MANWIEDSIWADNKDDWEKLLAVLAYRGSIFSYEALCPMPKALNVDALADTERDKAKSAYRFAKASHLPGYLRIPFVLDGLKKEYESKPGLPRTSKAFKSWLLLEKPEVLAYGRKLIENKENFGHETWYEWRRENWGVKWDVADEDLEIDADSFMIRWQSPWCPPTPIIRMISQKLPGVSLTFGWQDLDDDKGYYTQEWEDGVMTSQEFEPSPEYEEELKRQEEADRRGEAIGEAMYEY